MSVVIAFDTETCLFRPGVMAPELVCLTWMIEGLPSPCISLHSDYQTYDQLKGWLTNPDVILTAHNTQYDVAVCMARFPDLIPLFYKAYDEDRITCTKWRQILLDNACGAYRWRTNSEGKRIPVQYSLADCVARFFGRNLDKDTWRLRYGELINTPVEQWPEGARHYALEDARSHLGVYFAQESLRQGFISQTGVDPLKSQFHEARSYLALQLASVWGLRTDAAKVDLLEQQVRHEIDKVQSQLVEAGFVRTNGSRDTKKTAAHMIAVCAAQGKDYARTPAGGVALDADACELTEDDLLIAYARYSTLGTLLSKDVALLRKGVQFPVHTSFGFAESGRMTSSSPNIQNFAREVK